MTTQRACVDLINVFEVFLPQLLRYPNPTDPLNGEAAALMMREPGAYEQKVKGKSIMDRSETHFRSEYVQRYATKEAYDAAAAAEESSDDGEMSSVDSFSDDETSGMAL